MFTYPLPMHSKNCCDMPGWWKCGGLLEGNKRKINNIWANMNTAWTWGGSMCIWLLLWHGKGGTVDDDLNWNTRIYDEFFSARIQHAGNANSLAPSLSPFYDIIFLNIVPCFGCVGVGRGVVQCFMLCYHRTWWRRSVESGERKMLCMVVERKITSRLRVSGLVQGGCNFVIHKCFQYYINPTSPYCFASAPPNCLALSQNTNTTVGWEFSTLRWKEKLFSYPECRKENSRSSVQFSFVRRGFSNETNQLQHVS